MTYENVADKVEGLMSACPSRPSYWLVEVPDGSGSVARFDREFASLEAATEFSSPFLGATVREVCQAHLRKVAVVEDRTGAVIVYPPSLEPKYGYLANEGRQAEEVIAELAQWPCADETDGNPLATLMNGYTVEWWVSDEQVWAWMEGASER